ncbi:hypothetical protein BH10ACT1_BH10ACT1_22000 [soil metagenome]
MVRSRRAAMAMVAVGALALAACGSSDGSDGAASTTTKVSTATTTDAPSTTSAGTGTTEASPGTTAAGLTTTTESSEGRDTETSELDNLADGDHVGHIAGVENGTVEGQAVQVILFDEVQVLTGQEAIDAATADGVALEADYYVRDPESTLVKVAVAPDASVTTLQGGSADQVPSSVTEIGDAGDDVLHTIDTSTVRDVTLVNSIEGYYLA